MDIIPPSPRERYKHLRDPDLRRRSFGKWDSDCLLIKELIDEGFFSIDEDKKNVQCVYCGGVLTGVNADENVHIAHYRHFPKCERFKWRDTNFEALFSHASDGQTNGYANGCDVADTLLAQRLGNLSVDESDEGFVSGSSKDLEEDGVDAMVYLDGRGRCSSNPFYVMGELKFPRHTYYALYVDRLRTFKKWLPDLNQKPVDLATAGLFYTGNK